jgi:hypothetical protein
VPLHMGTNSRLPLSLCGGCRSSARRRHDAIVIEAMRAGRSVEPPTLKIGAGPARADDRAPAAKRARRRAATLRRQPLRPFRGP